MAETEMRNRGDKIVSFIVCKFCANCAPVRLFYIPRMRAERKENFVFMNCFFLVQENERFYDEQSLHMNTLSCFITTIHFPTENITYRGADKSLARPGRKQVTVTTLGICSTYSPRSSIQFLARCSNFCKPLKKIQKIVRPTSSPRQQ